MAQSGPERSLLELAGRVQENLVAYFRLFAGLPGLTSFDGDVFWFLNAGAEPGNHLLRAHLPDGAAERRIDEIFAEVGRHADQLDWLVFPGCRPADLGRRLEDRGLAGGPGGTWMLADLRTLPATPSQPAGFRIEQIRGAEELRVWSRLSAAGFGQDTQIYEDAYARHGFGPAASSLHYIGYLDDEPATSSTLLLAGGIAGIFDVSTPPRFRGRGLGGAITRAMMREARTRGYHDAWIWSSEMGKRVYECAGFTAVDLGVREYRWHRGEVRTAAP